MLTQDDFLVIHGAYGLYLGISIALTIWVARTLSQTGRLFLVRCFGQDEDLADSTNRLLVIGFYLINLGFICYRLGDWPAGQESLVGALGTRIGVTLLTLGLMHFINMLMIARMGRTVGAWMDEQRYRSERDRVEAPDKPRT